MAKAFKKCVICGNRRFLNQRGVCKRCVREGKG